MPVFAKLKISVNSDALLREMGNLGDAIWAPLRAYSDGSIISHESEGWKSIPLRSQGGSMQRTDPGGPGTEAFRDTEYLRHLPTFASVLRQLPCEIRSARLLALHPGAVSPTHRDDFIGLPYGHVRLHIPVLTNPDAKVTVGDASMHWPTDAVWFAEFSQPHQVANQGKSPRVHLVVDCLLSHGLLCVFPDEFVGSGDPDLVLLNPPLEEGRFSTSASVAFPISLTGNLMAYPDPGDTLVTATFATFSSHPALMYEGRPLCFLERLATNEWRMCGWTAERTFSFHESGATLHLRYGRQTRDLLLPQIGP